MLTVTAKRIVIKQLNPAIVWVLALLLVSSCGGVGVGTLLSGGGISGTGRFIGIITGFGSVFVNGVEIESTGAQISIDNNSNVVEGDLKVGMKVRIEAMNNIASSIVYKSEIKGPITNIDTTDNSFSVLGQTVLVDSTTVFDGINIFSDLNNDDIVQISGFADADANIVATFVELKDPGLTEFQIIGTVSAHNGISTFKINNMTIDYSNVQNPPAISDGSSVEVKGTLDQNAADTLIASEIGIEHSSYSSGDEVEIEGVITSLTSPGDFQVNNQSVQTNSQTQYEHGTASDLAINVRVEIKGSINSDNILIAEKVEVRYIESAGDNIEGQVTDMDIDGSTIVVNGLTIYIDLNTVFKDEHLRSFKFEDIQIGDYLEISGFYDNEGELVATKLERENSSD